MRGRKLRMIRSAKCDRPHSQALLREFTMLLQSAMAAEMGEPLRGEHGTESLNDPRSARGACHVPSAD
jgi:hypothetical protein